MSLQVLRNNSTTTILAPYSRDKGTMIFMLSLLRPWAIIWTTKLAILAKHTELFIDLTDKAIHSFGFVWKRFPTIRTFLSG
jgi:hypothetical protein